MTAIAPDSALRITRATTLEMVARGASDPLPAGVVGQVEGIALVYDVVDLHGTTFAKGCLERTVRERVKAGKVRLFIDHGDIITNGIYDTAMHAGVVRAVWDTEVDGQAVAKFRADIFDTASGREAHEYLRAIAATGSETGVSIGMLKDPPTVRCVINGQNALRISEVALGEISITAMSNSVPGTKVTAVRAAITEQPTATFTLDTGPETSTHPVEAVALIPPLPSASLNYEPLLRGIAAAIGADAFQLLTTGILSGDAEHRDSADMDGGNAGRSTAGSSAASSRDATTLDSQPAALGAARTDPLASTEARMAFVRAHFPRLYPP